MTAEDGCNARLTVGYAQEYEMDAYQSNPYDRKLELEINMVVIHARLLTPRYRTPYLEELLTKKPLDNQTAEMWRKEIAEELSNIFDGLAR